MCNYRSSRLLTNEALEEIAQPIANFNAWCTMAPLKTNLDDSFQIIIQTTHVVYLATNT
jgi:hypothetical protein